MKNNQLVESLTAVTAGPVNGKAAPKEEELQRSFVQFIKQGNSYRPAGPVILVDTLNPCAYQINLTMSGPEFERVKPKTDELMVFEDSNMDKIVHEIDRFWERKDNYSQLGLMHNRGIILYGPPGTGKSCCLQQVVEMMVKRGDVVFFAKSAGAISEGLKAFREVEPTRRTVVCFEEADELCRYDERTLLQLMDGDTKIDNVLFLACLAPDQKILTRDLRWKAAGDLEVGEKLWTLDEEATLTGRGGGRRYSEGEVISSFPALKECVRVIFESGEIITCTSDHPWLAFEGNPKTGHCPHRWVMARDLTTKSYHCVRPFKPWKTETSFEAGWLSGMMDGEGCLGMVKGNPNKKYSINITQTVGPVLDQLAKVASKFGEAHLRELIFRPPYKTRGDLHFLGGLSEAAKLLGSLRPVRLLNSFNMTGTRVHSRHVEKVIRVEPAGIQEIQSIETSTKTYFGEGFAMHNTTNYIDRLPPRMLRPGRFDKKIYVSPPTMEQRLRYLTHKLKDLAEKQQILDLAKKSDGFGFGHMRELIAGVYAMGEPVDEVLTRLRAPIQENHQNHQKAFALFEKLIETQVDGSSQRLVSRLLE
jgi:SpoVK/Ycf46/Vps4 family AAA+-type ATPase